MSGGKVPDGEQQTGADASVKPVVFRTHHQFSIDHLVDKTIFRQRLEFGFRPDFLRRCSRETHGGNLWTRRPGVEFNVGRPVRGKREAGHGRYSSSAGSTVQRFNVLTCLFFALFAFLCGNALAQTTQSRYYFAVENLATGAVIQRGTTTAAGIPQGGMILAPDTSFRFWLLEAEIGVLGYRGLGTGFAGSAFRVRKVPITLPLLNDSDSDGLTDDAEFIVGTARTEANTA